MIIVIFLLAFFCFCSSLTKNQVNLCILKIQFLKHHLGQAVLELGKSLQFLSPPNATYL